jgi:hypothetical protein
MGVGKGLSVTFTTSSKANAQNDEDFQRDCHSSQGRLLQYS